MHRQRRQDTRRTLGVLLLLNEVLRGAPIPPITLAAVAAQVAVFLEMIPFLSSRFTQSLCLLPNRIIQRKEWIRLFAPLIMHADDMHLYYNMVSFIWKGRRLEPLLGPIRYALTLVSLAAASAVITVGVSSLLDDFMPGLNYSSQCAVGFSGVIFALKVLSSTYTPEDVFLMGWLPVPSRWACWAELVLIQVLSPNASFVGHLAGILAGLLYTMGPLRWAVNAVAAVAEGAVGGVSGGEWEGGEERRNRGYSGASAPPYEGEGRTWGQAREAPSYERYTGGLSEEEQMRRAMEESMRQRRQPGYGWNID